MCTFPELCGNSSLQPHDVIDLKDFIWCIVKNIKKFFLSSLDYIHFLTKHTAPNTVYSSILRFSIYLVVGYMSLWPGTVKTKGALSMISEESGFHAELPYSNTNLIHYFCHPIMISSCEDILLWQVLPFTSCVSKVVKILSCSAYYLNFFCNLRGEWPCCPG